MGNIEKKILGSNSGRILLLCLFFALVASPEVQVMANNVCSRQKKNAEKIKKYYCKKHPENCKDNTVSVSVNVKGDKRMLLNSAAKYMDVLGELHNCQQEARRKEIVKTLEKELGVQIEEPGKKSNKLSDKKKQ